MIQEFQGKYRFLSNFWPAIVFLDGEEYATVEHAYQAAKCSDPAYRALVRMARTPGDAKRLGRRAAKDVKWEARKIMVMRDLVRQKFRSPALRTLLQATGDERLVEGNRWHDRFWGHCLCGTCPPGQNHLGRILEQVRAEL